MKLKGTYVWWPLTAWCLYRTLSECRLFHRLFGANTYTQTPMNLSLFMN